MQIQYGPPERTSIDDQVRVCRERIEQDGHRVVRVSADRAISGASLARPGIQSLMLDAANGELDLVYAEALDRISRDQEDVAAVRIERHRRAVRARRG